MKTLVVTSPNVKSPYVAALQELLQQGGWLTGPVDGEYGPLTAQAVQRAKFFLGYAKPDQVAGDALMAYLTGKKKPTPEMVKLAKQRAKAQPVKTPGEKILAFALTQVGVKESPASSNNVLYNRWYYGLSDTAAAAQWTAAHPGPPWCAVFLSYCATKTRGKFRYAYVPYVVHDAHAGANNLMLVHSSGVKPGDFVCYDWPGESRGLADHIGVFKGWKTPGSKFEAVEGNTSFGNNSNGGAVMERERNVSDVQAFARLVA